MNYKKTLFIIINILSLSIAYVYAAFENNWYGARMNSLSGAFVALADDTQTVFVQPAGITNLTGPEFSFSYGKLLMGLSDGSNIISPIVSIGYPLQKELGVGFGYKSIELQSYYSEAIVTGGIAYAPFEYISLGLSLKQLSVKYGSDQYTANDDVFLIGSKKSGMDADCGLIFRPLSFLNIAYAKQNIMGADIGIKDSAPVSGIDRIGISYQEKMFNASFENVRIAKTEQYLFGVEKLMYDKMFAIRFGIGWGNRDFKKLTAGVGFKMNRFSVDYSLDYPLSGIEETTGTHYLTLAIRIFEPGKKHFDVKRKAPDAYQEVIAPEDKRDPDESAIIPSTEQTDVPKTAGTMTPTGEAVSAPSLLSPATGYKALSGLPGMKPDTSTDKSISAKTPISVDSTGLDKGTGIDASGGLSPAIGLPALSPSAKPLLAPTAPSVAVKPVTPKPKSVKIKLDDAAKPQIIGPMPQSEYIAKPKLKKKKIRKRSTRRPVRSHRVSTGDTLPELAEKYYGKKASWIEIYEANKDKIEKGSLKKGQILVIP